MLPHLGSLKTLNLGFSGCILCFFEKFRVYVDKNTGVINNVHPE